MGITSWLKGHTAWRVLGIYLPLATVATLFALQVAGIGYADLTAYALELAPRSLFAICAMGLAEGFMRLRSFDLRDDNRAHLLEIIANPMSSYEDKVAALDAIRLENYTAIAALVIFALILMVMQ